MEIFNFNESHASQSHQIIINYHVQGSRAPRQHCPSGLLLARCGCLSLPADNFEVIISIISIISSAEISNSLALGDLAFFLEEIIQT